MNEQDVDDVIEAVIDIARKHSSHVPLRRGVPEMQTVHADDEVSIAHTTSADARGNAQELLKANRTARSILHRAFDTICAATGLVILSPLFLIIAAAIKWDDGGLVFFSQSRVGKDLRKFRLLKFRSMAPNSAARSDLTGPEDPRVTRVGQFPPKHKLDEFPHFVTLLNAQMHLV